MHFDDRLATVLRQPVTGEVIARIQYRQMLDLLGTAPAEVQGPQVDAAYLRLAELSRRVPVAERAALLREPGIRLRNPRLAAQLAEGEPPVAAAALAAARLGEAEWLDLIPALPVRARGFVRSRRDLGARVEAVLERLGITDRGLPPVAGMPPAPTAEVLPPEEGATQSRERIGAIVKRIEEFRKSRELVEGEYRPGESPRLPLEEAAAPIPPRRLERFDFATDAEGRIAWADTMVAPMAVGLRLGAQDPDSPVTAAPAIAEALRRRQPLRGARIGIAGAPAIAGDWIVDAAPRFDRPGGHFTGYCGRLRRPPPEPEREVAPQASEIDRMRQILHELRTPVNAIQGFAEVIQQQLFGTTPHEYRALAAAIAGDAARILAGFDELDRLVKLDSRALLLEPGECDLAAIVAGMARHVESFLAARGGTVALESEGRLPVGIGKADVERLVWRLLATLAGAAAPGETLRLALRPGEGEVRFEAQLPQSLAERDEQDLFRAAVAEQPQALSAGMFGTGFALRLAASEAHAAGGSLRREEDRLCLALPGLTARLDGHSDYGETFATASGAS